MKLSEVFGGFFKAAADAGIAIEADEPVKPVTIDDKPATADTSTADAERAANTAALAAAQARIAALETEARTAKHSALASAWAGDKATHISMLALLESNEPLFAAYVAQQNSAAEVARQSGLFQAAGSDRTGASSAWSQIESKARAVASAEHITIEQATVRVMDSDPALYRQYIEESK